MADEIDPRETHTCQPTCDAELLFVARLEVTRLTRELEAARERDNTRIHELDRARQDAIDARRNLAAAREELETLQAAGERLITPEVHESVQYRLRGHLWHERQMREASDRNCQVATERAGRATELLRECADQLETIVRAGIQRFTPAGHTAKLAKKLRAFLSPGCAPATEPTPVMSRLRGSQSLFEEVRGIMGAWDASRLESQRYFANSVLDAVDRHLASDR